MRRKAYNHSSKSFTLIELLAVLVIVSILLAVAIPTILGIIEKSKKDAFGIGVKNILRQLKYEQAAQILSFSGVGQNEDISYSWTVPNETICLSANNKRYEIVNMNCTDADVVDYGQGDKLRIVSVTGNPTEYTNKSVVLNVTAAGGVAPYQYSFDNGVTYQSSNKKEFFQNNTVYINVKDVTGKVLDYSYEVIIDKIDKEPPTITLTTNYIEINQNGSIDLNDYVKATDNIGVKQIIITGSLSNIIIGNYTINYQAEDVSGNLSEILSLVVKVKDVSAPVLVLSDISTDWYNTDVLVNVTMLENEGGSGTAGYVYCLKSDGKDCLDTDYSDIYTNNQILVSTEGNLMLSVKAVDSAGNYSNPVVRNIKIDKTPPTVTVNGSLTPLNIDHILGADFVIPTAVVSDSLSGINGSITTNGTVSNIVGTYTITYTVSDNANNIANFILNVNVIDTAAPDVTLTPSSPSASGWYTSAINILVTATDNDNISMCEYKVSTNNGISYPDSWITIPGVNNTTAKIISITEESSSIKVMVRCTDNSSKFNEVGTAILKHDETPPTCVSSGGNSTWTTATRTLTGTCSDTISGCSGNITKQYTTSINSTTESPGVVTDIAGNSGTCPANQTVKIDKSAPTCVSSGGSAAWTNGSITLTGTCSDTGGSGCSGNVTKLYTTSINSTTETPGVVTDISGNSGTCPANQTVKIDKVAPSASISINGGSTYATSASVTLTLSSTDTESGVSQMCISNTTSCTTWEAYAASKSWTLAAGDGSKTVYAWFRDAASNTSIMVSDTVTLDTVSPTGGVVINGGTAYATSTSATLTISASDGTTGVSQMCISNTTSCTAWEAYATSKAWTLTTGDGTKTVYIWFKDAAGNQGGSYSDSTTLDTTDPVYTYFYIGGTGNPTYVTSTSTTLAFSVSGASEMCISTTTSCSAWETYASSKAWTLTAGDGSKTLYAWFRDAAGNIIGYYPDSVTLDSTDPVYTYFYIGGTGNPAYATSTSTTLYFSVSGASEMCISTTTSCSTWESYASSKAYTLSAGDGAKTLYTWFRDAAGNIIGYYSDAITLDTTDPVFTYFYIGGTGNPNSVTSTSTTLYFSVSGASEMCISTTTSCSAWEAYASSKAYTLSAGYGTKTLYAWFRDAALNQIGYYSDSVDYLQGTHSTTYTCTASGYSYAETSSWIVSTSSVIQGSPSSGNSNYWGIMFFDLATIKAKWADYDVSQIVFTIYNDSGSCCTTKATNLYVGGPCPTLGGTLPSSYTITGSKPTALDVVTIAAPGSHNPAVFTITKAANQSWINDLMGSSSKCLYINKGDASYYWEGQGSKDASPPKMVITWTPR